MRLFICFAMMMLIFYPMYVQSEVSGAPDKQSIIIEVAGDPKQHADYFNAYHPFIEVIHIYDMLFNGLALQGTPEKLAKIHALDFIKVVHPNYTYETKPDSLDSKLNDENMTIPSDLNTTTYTGKGIKVGVIDTGIDYTHPDLRSNYVSGYDVVDLDDDPMETLEGDVHGGQTLHGTHVAGIIAANGKLKGVAPEASIYAYRALGPGGRGTSVQVIAAMEQAVKDGVDVINMSLGNTINGPDYPTSIAVNRAVDLGVAVVIANGNDGPAHWTVGSPATATKALAVGASSQPYQKASLFEPIENKEMSLSLMVGSVPWELNKAYQIVHVSDEGVNVNGKIALIERSDIPFFELAQAAEDGGAVATIIYNHMDEDIHGSIESDQTIHIPVGVIPRKDGQWLIRQIQKRSLYIETTYDYFKENIAPFSSRGPVTVNWDIKPDILAPGTNVLSTVPQGYEQLQGTSMAAPHVAGAVAILKEAKPEWTNEQIFGALKTTAKQIKTEEGENIDSIIQGMGMIQLERAINTETIIDQPLLALGRIDTFQKTKAVEIKVENQSDMEQTYVFDIPKKMKGMSWKLPQMFTVQPKEHKVLPIELTVTTSIIDEGVHQGWLTLNEGNTTYHLPYLFVSKTADHPKAMGFSFSLKPFSKSTYHYQLYVTDEARHVEVHLYDHDTLMYERSLLRIDEPTIGMNEGEMTRKSLGNPGYYKALITVMLKNGTYESFETEIIID